MIIRKRQSKTFLRNRPILERMHDCITYEPNTGCWIWIGCIANSRGYGSIRYNGKKHTAHRLLYELTVGKIPDGMYVCHKCDMTACVNPDHMFVGTQKDNMADMIKKGRRAKTHESVPRKLTNIQVLLIREAVGSQSEISKRFNISPSMVWAIKNNKAWKNIKPL